MRGTISRAASMSILLLALPAVGVAQSPDAASSAFVPPPPPSFQVITPEPQIAQGMVVDARGVPLEGVVVTADHQLIEDYGLDGVTGTDGRYRIELMPEVGAWRMSAQLERTFQGQTYRFALDPVDDTGFAGVEGGVRDFVWRLSGPTPQGFGYGGNATVYTDYAEFAVMPADVELILAPEGPLVDGSVGQAVTGRGDVITDVPIGRYTATARWLPVDGPVEDLLIRIRDTGDYGPSVSVVPSPGIIAGEMSLQVARASTVADQ